MSLLDKASLIVTPNAYEESKLYSVVPNTTLGDMDVVRATTATRVNSAGLIEVVPRNLFTYSEQFENIAWTKVLSTIIANDTTSPSGIVNADKYIPNTTNAFHPVYQTRTITSGVSYSFSIYVKSAGYNFLLINTVAGSSSGNVGPLFDLSNGTLIGSLGGNNYNATITSVGNSWYKIDFSYITNGVTTEIDINCLPTSSIASFAGNGTSGIFIWGAQLEAFPTATEYFPTTTRLNIPLIDYTNGSCPSLLVEPQRTNLNLYSEDFGNAYWTLFAATRTLNVANSPSGIQNADKLIEDNTNSFHSIYLSSNFTVTIGQAYTRTVYAKADGRNWISLLIVDSSQYRAFFDLQNGVIGNVSSGITAKITNVGNGWYRCEITRIAATISLSSMAIELAISNGTGSYLGNGTSGVYLWGAQLELGSYATSYIPTVASTVTRNADVISKTGISSLIGQTEGVIFLDCKIYPTDTKRLAINDGTIANVIFLQSDATNRIRFLITQNSISILDTGNFTLPNPNGFNKIAFKYKSNDFAIWVNGTKIYSSTAVTLSFPVALSKFAFDFSASGLSFFGEVKSAQLYKTALTDTELQSLTTL